MEKLCNYFVLLGINNQADEDEIDKAVNGLTEETLYELDCDATEIRRTLGDREARAQMWAALIANETFNVNYNTKNIKIEFSSKLPNEYGEFTVYCGDGRGSLEPGRYSQQFLADKNIRETGTYLRGTISVLPYAGVKVYYPAVRRGELVYIIGREKNRAFVHEINYQYTYEYVTATFKWGKFSEVIYLTSAKTEIDRFPPNLDDTLKSLCAPPDGISGKLVGKFTEENRRNKIRFYERNIGGEYYELEVNG